MTIQRLQDEMLEHIISLVPPQDIPVLMGVCKQWARIIRGPTICTILFQHHFPRLTCDRRTVYAEWQKEKLFYKNIRAKRFVTSRVKLTDNRYVFVGGRSYDTFYQKPCNTHVFKELILVERRAGLSIFRAGKELLRTGLDYLGIEDERIICWNGGAIISIDEQLQQQAQSFYCESKPVLYGSFLYYISRGDRDVVVQLNRRTSERKEVSGLFPHPDSLHASGSILYLTCRDLREGRLPYVVRIDMERGIVLTEVDGHFVACNENRLFTLINDSEMHAYNTRGELEQTYSFAEESRGICSVDTAACFNRCTLFSRRVTPILTPSFSFTHIWNTETGQLLATFPDRFLWKDQGKLYFLNQSKELIVRDFGQPTS